MRPARLGRPAVWRSPRPIWKPRYWFAPARFPSWSCCGHRAATRASSWATFLPASRPTTAASGRSRRSTSTLSPGWRRCSVCRPSRPSWRWVGDSRCRAFRGCSHPSSCGGGSTRCLNATAGKLGGGDDAEDPEQVDPELAQARAHLDAGDFDAARSAYQAILDANPSHVEAKGAVRQIGFLQRASAHRPDAVATADAAPDDIDAAFAAADVEILQQNIAAAFDRLIALVKRTAGDDRTSVRTRLIELVRSLRSRRSRGHRGSAQAGQRAVLIRTSRHKRPPTRRGFGDICALQLRGCPARAGTQAGSNHNAVSGGSTMTADAGRPCHGSSVASTAP